jgi:pimeloyl-ACP methyl ester carboxylesterase
MSPQELTLELPNLRLAARAWGDPAATHQVLALHGWLDNAASFDRLAPLIPDARIVALDLPGHGRSDHRPRGNWYHFIDYLGDALAAADALGFERFTLLGHSLGGAISSLLAAAAPDRVEALWLIEALGPMSTDPGKSLPVLRQAIVDRAGVGAKTLRVFPTLDLAVAARRQANGLSEQAAQLLVERGTTAVAGGWTWSSDPRLTLTSAIRMTEEQILAYLSGIGCPTLLVLADPPPPWIPPAAMNARIACVPDLSLQRITGTHHLHLEDPGPVAAARGTGMCRPKSGGAGFRRITAARRRSSAPARLSPRGRAWTATAASRGSSDRSTRRAPRSGGRGCAPRDGSSRERPRTRAPRAARASTRGRASCGP